MGMFNQFHRCGNHTFHIEQLSGLNFKFTMDNGEPVYFQPHKPATFFPIFDKIANTSSLQMSFEGFDNG